MPFNSSARSGAVAAAGLLFESPQPAKRTAAASSAIVRTSWPRSSYADLDLVFADALGSPIHPQRLSDRFSTHRKAAGISTGSLHILRHTSATLALTAGVPVHIVAARLGDDPKTVLSTYAHLLPQADELAAERVAAALVGAS